MTRTFKVDSDAVRQLADILVETHLSEIEYEDEGRRIRVARKISIDVLSTAAPTVAALQPSVGMTKSEASPSTEGKSDYSTHPGLVKSPLVGTAYMAAEPGAAPFVSVGDTVTIGQTLLIVEAMKVMNPIKASKAGRVTQVFVQDSAPVEFSEPLMIIE